MAWSDSAVSPSAWMSRLIWAVIVPGTPEITRW